MRAGVATSTMPSTMVSSAKKTVYSALLSALGKANVVKTVTNRPPTTRLARPQRSPARRRAGERTERLPTRDHQHELREGEAELLG